MTWPRFTYGLIVFAIAMLVAALFLGCNPDAPPAQSSRELVVTRTTPDEHGVVCYQAVRSSQHLSCVKVR